MFEPAHADLFKAARPVDGRITVEVARDHGMRIRAAAVLHGHDAYVADGDPQCERVVAARRRVVSDIWNLADDRIRSRLIALRRRRSADRKDHNGADARTYTDNPVAMHIVPPEDTWGSHANMTATTAPFTIR